jgi:hypothetical protein
MKGIYMSEDITITNKLKKATDGLMFQSESDYPIELFYLEGNEKKSIARDDILNVGKHPAKTLVKTMKLEDFFASAIQEQSWHGAEEKEIVNRFRELVHILKEDLSDVKVFKVGKVEIDVYVIGKIESGDFAGVKTKVVET